MDKLQVFQDIHQTLTDGHLDFPANARVTLKLRDALDNPDCDIRLAVRLIEAEPILAARIIALANSVAYNPYGREISDLKSAATRLGFAALRSLCMALLTRQLAAANLPDNLQKIGNQLWQHTTHVAALSRVIARKLTGVDPEAALFSGLIHELPGFYLLSRAQVYPGILDGDGGEWVETGERLLGEPLLLALNVPEPIRTAIHLFWDGYLSMPAVSLGDTLLLADQLAPVPSPLRPTSGIGTNTGLEAHIEMAIGENLLTDILQSSAEEIRSLAAAMAF